MLLGPLYITAAVGLLARLKWAGRLAQGVAVATLVLDGDQAGSELPEALHTLVEHAILASPSSPTDPME